MSNLKGYTGVSSVTRPTTDGAYIPVRASRDGSIYTVPYLQGLAMEGRLFIANAGTGTSTVQCAGVYSATASDFNIDVPLGTTILPVSIEVTLDAMTDDQDVHIHALASRSLAAASGTTITQVPLRTDNIIQSMVTCKAAASSQTTLASTGHYEFWRRQFEFGAKPEAGSSEEGGLRTVRWSALDDGVFPVIVGEGAMGLHVAKTTEATVFITVVWAELPSNTIL